MDLIAVAQIPFLAAYMTPMQMEISTRGMLNARAAKILGTGGLRLRSETDKVWWPAGQAASVIQSHAMRIVRISYSNPADVTTSVKADAEGVARIIETFLTIGAKRRIFSAQATREELEAIAEESLLSATIDERFFLKERSRVALEIEEEKLHQERIETERQRVMLAASLMETIKAARDQGFDIPAINTDQLVSLLDNSRIIASLGLAHRLRPHVELTPSD